MGHASQTCMRIDTETGLVFHRGLMVRSTLAIRALQVLVGVFGGIYAMFLSRFVLTYVGAEPHRGFAELFWDATALLYAPFQSLVDDGDDGAGHPLEWSLLVAIAGYAVVHVLLRRLVLALGRA